MTLFSNSAVSDETMKVHIVFQNLCFW